jgi:uncharacterized protein
MTDSKTQRIPLFPLGNGLFPDSLLQLNIFEVRYLNLMKECEKAGTPFGVVWLEQGSEIQSAGKTQVFHPNGTLANIQLIDKIQPTLLRVRCVGGLRFTLTESELGPFGVWYGNATFEAPDPVVDIPTKFEPLAARLGELIATAQKQGFAENLPFDPPYRLDECGWVANRWAELIPFPATSKIEVLMENNPLARLEQLSHHIDL